jgi:hypothetical protein
MLCRDSIFIKKTQWKHFRIKIKNKKTNSVNSFYFRDVSTYEAAIIKQKNILNINLLISDNRQRASAVLDHG